jgi:rfaE bifunctional protein nucleotidyltransferase chain/domain
MSFNDLLEFRAQAGADGRKIVLTNGCFDLLHRGHVAYLTASAALGDLLVVAINSDASVRSLKGPTRPLNTATDRAYVLAALRCVDAVFIFDTPRLDNEIRQLRPEIYTKAGDYTPDSLDPNERAALDQVAATIHIIPFVEGHSTTSIIDRATIQ